MITDLKSQSVVVLNKLMENDKMTRQQATDTWFNSRTKTELEKRKLFFVSGMRCYWELKLELSEDSRWMSDTFE